MKNYSLFIAFWLFFFMEASQAQQQLLLNYAIIDPGLENIAATGSNTAVQAVYRRNWLALFFSPELMLLHVEGRFQKSKESWDLKLNSASSGIIKFTEMKLGFCHHLLNKENQRLSFGIRTGFIRTSLDWNAVSAKSPEELEKLYTYGSTLSPSFDAGFYYTMESFKIAISSKHFLSDFHLPTQNEFRILSDNNLVFSWTSRKLPLQFMPMIAVKSTQGMPFLVSTAIQCKLPKTGNMTVGFKTNGSIFFGFTLLLQDQFSIHYLIDSPIRSVRFAGFGNEFVLTYNLKKK